jgi:type II secretory pathway pseudopilin PulG
MTPAGGPARAPGFSLLELALVLGIAGLLAGLGMRGLSRGHATLTAVQGELRACVEQAFLLARARGRAVRLQVGEPVDPPGGSPSEEILPLILPRGVRWGVPDPGMQLPKGAEHTLRAHLTGRAHPSVSVTPGGTALATSWFLTDGEDAVCLRLSDHGDISLFRWRRRLPGWQRI